MTVTKSEILELLVIRKAGAENALAAYLADEDNKLFNEDGSDNLQVQAQVWNYINALAVANPKAKAWVEENL